MEKKEFIDKYLPYVKWCILTVTMIVALFFWEKPLSKEGAQAIVGALSNCFFVPGVLVTSIGVLSYLSKLGAYDGISYTFSNFSLHSIIPGHHKDKHQTLYEYKKQKDEKGRKWLPHAFFVGLVSLGIGVALVIVYAFL